MSLYRNRIGRWGEQTARDYLGKRGYQLLQSNYRTPFGEIDLILEMDAVIHFVEVKTRTTTAFGNPETGMTRYKFRHVFESAQYYLQEFRGPDQLWQIDCVAIIGKPGMNHPDVAFFENIHAFE